ncbi:MAG: GNAT family N-acetyltransferase [Micropruina sp.]|nr:MAG: GNAT family N-acetyltransferase [Micropruina sp.]
MSPELIAPNVRFFDSWQANTAEWQDDHQAGAGVWIADELGFDLATRDGFAGWVERLLVEADPSFIAPGGRVPATTLWVVEGEEYLGAVNLRHRLNEFLARIGGHIGYGIRPSARRRGLATFALRGALARAANLGIERALVTCDVGNEGSWRTIERCGGVLESVIEPDAEALARGFDQPKRRYWVPTGLRP